MAIREIPKSYEYTCDKCSYTHIQENASGHYTNSTPYGWSRLKWRVARDNEDETNLLLCMACTGSFGLTLAGWRLPHSSEVAA